MSGYRLSPSARADLREIWFYTSDTWSETQADRYLAQIESTCVKLAAGELIGRQAGEFRRGYFKIAVGSHFVFYKIVEPDKQIDVMRVLHQKMNLSARLGRH